MWCDRAQPEDQRLLAAQRAAKLRAARELGSAASLTHKLGKAHHAPADVGLASLVNRPPARLSATEANDDSSGDEQDELYMGRARSGSGRSSLNSNHRSSRVYGARAAAHGDAPRKDSLGDMARKDSHGSSARSSPNPSAVELAEPRRAGAPGFILEEAPAESRPRYDEPARTRVVSSYLQPSPPMDRAALKRSGSVDEREARTMTMSGLRLVVANPD